MRRNNQFWNMSKNETANSAELTLYGTIGSEEYWDDISDKKFKKDIEDLGDVSNIKLYINSPGGSVSAATAIYNTLKNHKANIEIYIDGFAASAATIISCAGDKVYMPNNAIFMIHNPWTYTWGDSKELNKTADTLEKYKDTIINTYVNKTGQNKEILSQLMDDESYLTAAEAKEYGFIDEILHEESNIENFANKLIVNGIAHDMSNFKNNPFKNMENRQERNARQTFTEEPKNKENKEEKMTKAELKEKFPALYNEIIGEGAEEERKRIQDIEENAPAGYEELVTKAKFEEPVNYQVLAVSIIREQQEREKVQSKINAEILDNIKKENGAGLERIEGAAGEETQEIKDKNAAERIINRMKGGKK